MTDRTQPEALRLAAWLNEGAWHQMRLGDVEAAGRELRRQHTRIAELESELEAVGAGGVQALSAAPAQQAGEATESVPAREHDLQDVRCECCGYMTYHREHMGCIHAARKQ